MRIRKDQKSRPGGKTLLFIILESGLIQDAKTEPLPWPSVKGMIEKFGLQKLTTLPESRRVTLQEISLTSPGRNNPRSDI